MKLELYITPPDGYEVVKIGKPKDGDFFVDIDLGKVDYRGVILIGDVCRANGNNNYNSSKLILKKKKQKKEIIIFESTGEFREPREGEYYRISTDDRFDAIGYMPNHCVKVGNKEIFKCINKYTREG